MAELSQGRDTTPGLSIHTVEPADCVVTPAESINSFISSSDEEEEEEIDGDVPPPAADESSLDNSRHSLTDFSNKATARIADLQVELEEVKRLNDSLQNQLAEHDRLRSENEQQRRECELERDNLAQQVVELQTQLQLTEAQSQEHTASNAVDQQEVEELRNQMSQLAKRCKALDAQLQEANAEIQRLKDLQSKPKLTSSPKRTVQGLQLSPTKSPSKSPIAGNVKALQEKYQESIRLNQELQERLHAQLKTTPPTYTPDNSFTSSAGTSPRKQEAEL